MLVILDETSTGPVSLIIFGMEGPYKSASNNPTLQFKRDKDTARFTMVKKYSNHISTKMYQIR